MMTREQILEIDQYCQEHGIAPHQYFIWKRKYRQQDAQVSDPGTFVQLQPRGAFVPSKMPPLALGRKNYLFCGNHDAAVRAAIVYSLFSSCKAAGIEVRGWLEDVLRRIEPGIKALLPANWTITGNH